MKFDFIVTGMGNKDIMVSRIDTIVDMDSLVQATNLMKKECQEGKISSNTTYTFDSGKVYKLELM